MDYSRKGKEIKRKVLSRKGTALTDTVIEKERRDSWVRKPQEE